MKKYLKVAHKPLHSTQQARTRARTRDFFLFAVKFVLTAVRYRDEMIYPQYMHVDGNNDDRKNGNL